jgi:hypothetical protein
MEETVTTRAASRNGSATTDARVELLEQQVQLLAWLLAEQSYRSIRLATMVAAMVAQQMQPQLQQNILNQLMDQS